MLVPNIVTDLAVSPKDTGTDMFGDLLDRLRIARPTELILIQPSLVPEEMFNVATARAGGYFNYPPVGLLYIAAVAREVCPAMKVRIIDLNHELLKLSHDDAFGYRVWQDILRDAISGCSAPVLGLSFMFGTTKACFKAVSEFLRAEFPRAPILVGGVQATYDFEEILRENLCDVVFRKEGEVPFEAFLRSCAAGHPSHLPDGIAFLTREGSIFELGTPKANAPVDWNIADVYDLIEVESYHKYGSLGAFSRYIGADKPFATALSLRGCRARCTFCTVRDFNGFGLRSRAVQSVIDEIKFLVEKKGIRYLDWLDDDLLWDPKRAVELFRGLAEQVPNLEWTAQNGLIAVAIDEEVMEWMVRSGLKAFKIGIESGNDKMLKVIKKPTTKPKLREKRKLFQKYPEVFVGANFIIGFPNETFAQMMDSFNFATELRYDWSSFFICQPLKGTDMYTAFESLGDARTHEESYLKMPNPARQTERGEFGYRFDSDRMEARKGWDVFSIPVDAVPTLEQQKEIWFAFNFVCNFLRNQNFEPGGNPGKIVRWLESLRTGYPHDASMVATLSHAYRLCGDVAQADGNRDRFLDIIASSAYWQERVEQFPEMFFLAGVSQPPRWYRGPMPTSLNPDKALGYPGMATVASAHSLAPIARTGMVAG